MLAGKHVAYASLAFAALGIGVSLTSAIAAHFGALAPFLGLSLASLGLVLGGFPALLLGLAAVLRRGGASYRRAAIAGTALGTVLMLIPAALGARAGRLPPIHDLTTDPADPPVFVRAGELAANRDRDLAYPHGLADTPERQREGYPDLVTIELDTSPDDAFAASLAAAAELGWSVHWSDPAGGRFEATDRSPVFRLVDDVAVRVRADPRAASERSLIDVRSTARDGVSDLGRNARRIRAFAELMARGRAL